MTRPPADLAFAKPSLLAAYAQGDCEVLAGMAGKLARIRLGGLTLPGQLPDPVPAVFDGSASRGNRALMAAPCRLEHAGPPASIPHAA